jgi:DNA processing protein
VGSGVGLDSWEVGEVEAFLRLKASRGMGDRRIRELVEKHGSGVGALRRGCTQEDLWATKPGNPDLISFREKGGRVVPMTSPHYPPRLLELVDPPPLLFLSGQDRLLSAPSVAIVGSRRATPVGRRVAEDLGRVLSRAGITVVSGMALGIDGAAHRGALTGRGSTVAILGSGLDVVHPPSHRPLSQQIRQKGLLVSEFLPAEPALPFHFPKRNRIIAALALALIVVEAGKKSGALISVDHALDLGREILAVPGSVENPQASGSNALLRDGARLITDPEVVLEELGDLIPRGTISECSSSDPPDVPSELLPLWSVLSPEPLGLDHLATHAAITPGEALAGLTTLELGGWVVRCPGMHFQRRRAQGA